jgi:hypothetical protein
MSYRRPPAGLDDNEHAAIGVIRGYTLEELAKHLNNASVPTPEWSTLSRWSAGLVRCLRVKGGIKAPPQTRELLNRRLDALIKDLEDSADLQEPV